MFRQKIKFITCYKKIVLTFVVGILIFFLILEFGLRLLGYYHHSTQINYTKSNIKILALGESTTAQNQFGSWPESLQNLLDQKALNANVINEGIPGTMTTLILSKTPLLLEKIKPSIVITMMGINDTSSLRLSRLGLISTGSFFQNLRSVKFFKLLFADVNLKNAPNNSAIQTTYLDLSSDYINLLKNKRIVELNQKIYSALLNKNEISIANFYVNFYDQAGAILFKEGGRDYFKFVFNILKDAIPFAHKYTSLPEHILFLAKALDRKNVCQQILNNFVNDKIAPSEDVINRGTECLESDDVSLNNFLNQFELHLQKSNVNEVPTRENYQAFFKIIKQQKICWIVMQYPLLDVNQLKEFFTEDQKKVPYLRFVSNKENFEQVLLTHPAQEIFFDKFGGKFGHSKKIGHALVAKQVFAEIEKALKDPVCMHANL